MWIVPKNYRPLSASALAWVDSKEVLKSEEDLNINSSLAWRGKLMPVDSWCRKWNQVSYLPALFGRTLRHSHRIYFETAVTSYLQDIHANRSQLRTQRQTPMLKIKNSLLKCALTRSILCSCFDLPWSDWDECWSELIQTDLPELF